MKKLVREYFLLSRKERNGLMVLVAILLLIVIVPEVFIRFSRAETSLYDTHWSHIKKGQHDGAAHNSEDAENLFEFDPNSATEADLADLGLSDRCINHIANYRNKGGIFYSRDDLLKINDFSKEDYLRLRKYIRINNLSYKKYPAGNVNSNLRIDINKADSASLTKLKGIGPVFAARIIKYRNSINGFNNLDQLKEVYGLNEELVEQLRPFLILTPKEEKAGVILAANIVLKEKVLIDLNKADTLELIKLKGIGPAYSRRIFKYRNLLGGFATVDQLKEVYGLQEETIESIKQEIFLNSAEIKKININKGSFSDLTAHPYINKNLADYIIKYRSKKPFTALEELKESFLVEDDLYRKLAPYLEI